MNSSLIQTMSNASYFLIVMKCYLIIVNLRMFQDEIFTKDEDGKS